MYIYIYIYIIYLFIMYIERERGVRARGNHLSNTTCLTHVSLESGEESSKRIGKAR